MRKLIWWLAALAAMATVGLFFTVSPAVSSDAGAPTACTASGSTLGQAIQNYNNTCTAPRVDCDPSDSGWTCSSERIGSGAPTTTPILEVTTTTAPNNGACTAAGPSLAKAQQNYASSCSQPRVDCDPSGSGWVCSSEQIGSGGAPTPTPTTPGPAPTPTPTTPGTPGGGDCGVIALEAESLPLTGAWNVKSDGKASGGSYIAWEGLSRERNNNSPADIMRIPVSITKTGTYRFTWAMRQPSDVAGDKANDSWVNFPSADRFGPMSGGAYGGFMKVYGNAKGDFKYAAKGEKNHDFSDLAIEFRSPGTYTMEVAGRSHGHQIDRIVLFHDSISQSNAIASNGCSGPNPAPTPNPTPGPAPVSGPFDSAKDLLVLHYDHAPDRDDGHATVAGREVTADYRIDPLVVGGAYGTNRNTYNTRSEAVMNATWGTNGWLNAHRDWNGTVSTATNRWASVLNSGGDIWIAEGGQSDLTADVVRAIKGRLPNVDTQQRIHVVQHSKWNEDKTTGADLSYAKNQTEYIKIEDGNNQNSTADLNNRDNGFSTCALGGQFGSAWRAAFDYYPAYQLVDFSDTVELLHILGVGKNRVANASDFCDVFVKGNPTPAPTPAPNPGPTPTPNPSPGGACTATGSSLAEAQRNYANSCSQPRVDCDPSSTGWICSSELMGGGGAPAPSPSPMPAPNPSPSPSPAPNASGLPSAPAGYTWVRVDAVTDEFNGSSLDRNKWLNDHPFWNGREPSQFLPANVSVGGGNLQLKSTVANRSQSGNWVNSAAVTSNTKVGQGYYEARVKASRISMTSSFWFQTSGGPRHEIDVVENVGAPRQKPSDASVMHSNSHYNYGRANAISTPKRWTMPSGAGDDYHVYGVWWKSERDIWLYHNGVKVNEIRTGGPFNADQHMFFDTEVFRWVGNPTVAELDDNSKNTMYVDWVRGWQLVKS